MSEGIGAKVFAELRAYGRAHEALVQKSTRGMGSTEQASLAIERFISSPRALADSTVLWITEDMCDLLLHASRSLPPYPFTLDVLPWECAICFCAKPLFVMRDTIFPDGEAHTTAVQWFVARDAGVTASAVVGLSHVDGPDVLSPSMLIALKEGDMWNAPPPSNRALSQDMAVRSDFNEGIARIVSTLWVLLRQKVAVKRPLNVERAARRQWQRTTGDDRPIPGITIVELRRPLSSDSNDPQHIAVDWSHRWIVDGHWRNQFHPSDKSHVPTWIAPYVKGPDDKPLVVKDRIHAWVR